MDAIGVTGIGVIGVIDIGYIVVGIIGVGVIEVGVIGVGVIRWLGLGLALPARPVITFDTLHFCDYQNQLNFFICLQIRIN